jgi:hypothetical protein
VYPLFVLLAISNTACTMPGRWVASPDPSFADACRLMCSEELAGLEREVFGSEIPGIPPREKVRLCCVFGGNVRVRVGPFPIPGFRILNVVDVDHVGPHTYDSGVLDVGEAGEEPLVFNPERNGLGCTCRGGFIDTAPAAALRRNPCSSRARIRFRVCSSAGWQASRSPSATNLPDSLSS